MRVSVSTTAGKYNRLVWVLIGCLTWFSIPSPTVAVGQSATAPAETQDETEVGSPTALAPRPGIHASVGPLASPRRSHSERLAQREWSGERVELLGGSLDKLSGALVAGGNVIAFRLTEDGTTAVYTADQDTDEVFELYSVPIDGSAAPTKISGTMAGNGVLDRNAFLITPDGATVVYLADQDTPGQRTVYAVPIDGSATPTKLSPGLPPPREVTTIGLTPDGTRVAYFIDLTGAPNIELFTVPITGPLSASVQLSSAASNPGGNVTSALFTSDSATTTYTADEDPLNDETFDLFSVPADGSGPAIKLNAPIPSGSFIGAIGISPDGTRVVYASQEDIPGTFEFFSIPVAGPSGSATKLNGPMSGGAVSQEISPDGTLVAYRAQEDFFDVIEVYSVPIDGSAASVKLSGTMVFNGDATTANFSPDGSRVAYTADQDTEGTFELFSAPSDGSEPAIKLHAAGPGESVGFIGGGTRFLAGRVVYPVFAGGVAELYSVPVDSSQPFVRVHPELPVGGSILSIYVPTFANPEILAYRAEQNIVGAVDGLTVPANASLPAVQFNAPHVPPQDVSAFEVTSDEAVVVFLADQDTAGTFELFARVLDSDQDGTADLLDNCRLTANPAQGPVVFGQDVIAPSKTEFSWSGTTNVRFVRGPLDMVGSYVTDLSGTLFDVIAYNDTTVPAAGAGSYYLFEPECAAGSWQTVPGAEPQRDLLLP